MFRIVFNQNLLLLSQHLDFKFYQINNKLLLIESSISFDSLEQDNDKVENFNEKISL